MQIGAGMIHKAAEEILHEFSLQIADQPHTDQVLINERGTPAQVEGDDGQRLVHG